ncbi:hypothetical protein CFP71_06985 [Amycolatopsis thailandensis]|uniref:Uncharacterized protein n=1 Tax=Amycolatopsis thailandensis TaxID=589330 RepID=A0A229SF74_9PSEU|nr:hypothetical protein [Amycolatopsis thailandensis]OXM57562.1 hypothetical protein CFP71_06985 [Amycolatopsis thailandensis]
MNTRLTDPCGNDPANFVNVVDIACVPYSTLQIGLFSLGCVLWGMAYLLLLRNSLRNRFVEMPIVAACSNLAWEFAWAWLFEVDLGMAFTWAIRGWFLLDLVIFVLVLRHGRKQLRDPRGRGSVAVQLLVTAVVFAVLYTTLINQGLDNGMGAVSAYIAQLFISVLYYTLALRPDMPTALFSTAFGYLRTAGSAVMTVFMLLHYPESYFLLSMALLSAALDVGYLVLFNRKKRAEKRAEPLTAPPAPSPQPAGPPAKGS